jgi:hypothetical protein
MYDYVMVGLIALFGIFGNRQESRVLITFSALCLIMLLLGESNQKTNIGYQYHFLACWLLHAYISHRINKEQKISELIYCISNINLSFFYLNLFGLFTLFFHTNPVYYNIGCEILYSFALAAIIDDWWFNGFWRTGVYRFVGIVRSNLGGDAQQLCLGKKEART